MYPGYFSLCAKVRKDRLHRFKDDVVKGHDDLSRKVEFGHLGQKILSNVMTQAAKAKSVGVEQFEEIN